MSDLITVKLKSSGNTIEVYKSILRGTYVWFEDCKTEYKKEELIFT